MRHFGITARSAVGGFDQPSGPHTAHDTPRDSVSHADELRQDGGLALMCLALTVFVGLVSSFIAACLVIWGLFFS